MLVGGCKLVYKKKKIVYGMDLIKQNNRTDFILIVNTNSPVYDVFYRLFSSI